MQTNKSEYEALAILQWTKDRKDQHTGTSFGVGESAEEDDAGASVPAGGRPALAATAAAAAAKSSAGAGGSSLPLTPAN